MNIGYLQIGFGNEIKDKVSLNIYLAGCKNNKKCEMAKCHNPELRDFNIGDYWTTFNTKIEKLLKEELCNSICLLGGEPLDQNKDELKHLLDFLKKFNLPIYVYSGYDKQHILNNFEDILTYFTDIIYGHYSENYNNKDSFNDIK